MKKFLKVIGILFGLFVMFFIGFSIYLTVAFTEEELAEMDKEIAIKNRKSDSLSKIVEFKADSLEKHELRIEFVSDSLLDIYNTDGSHKKVIESVWERIPSVWSYKHHTTNVYKSTKNKDITKIYTWCSFENEEDVRTQLYVYADIDKDNNILTILFK